ncbi:hypothetical protein NIES4101_26760 (plasmid) [Calothrix sp. NIES-4101]|nr:hypothetical protein NIES4101_26760 [Calothrix sp. NIES-4101]
MRSRSADLSVRIFLLSQIPATRLNQNAHECYEGDNMDFINHQPDSNPQFAPQSTTGDGKSDDKSDLIPQQPPIPQLTTPETARLRENYPSIEHLEAGNVAAWLQERQDQLLSRATEGRASMNLAKLITLAGGAVGAVCYATSPIAPIAALIGFGSYIWTVAKDNNATHKFAPVPFVRGSFWEFLSAMGDAEAREQWFENQDDLLDLLSHMERMERTEYAMLREFKQELTDYLSIVDSGKKFYAYRWLLDSFEQYRGSLPSANTLKQHLEIVTVDPRTDFEQVNALIQHQSQQQQPRIIDLPPGRIIDLPPGKINDLSLGNINDSASTKINDLSPTKINNLSPENNHNCQDSPHKPTTPNRDELLKLPLTARAEAIIKALTEDGFDIAKCIQDQISAIAGNQRGGKGTLMAILAILSFALNPQTKIHYFTAGDDIYPFKCDKLLCRLNWHNLDGSEADAKVAQALFKYLKKMDNATQGVYDDVILVIDEAVALSGYLTDDQKEWMVKYLLTRANKKGAQIFVVLHGKHLSTWVGKNTNGMADTFKSGVSFIGCESTSIQVSALKRISVATGRYFLADPDSFDKAVKGGEIGILPDWMKTEQHPINGQPDPARTLLTFFPELVDNNHNFENSSSGEDVCGTIKIDRSATVDELENLWKLSVPEVDCESEIDEAFLSLILELVAKASAFPVSFEAIRKHKSWERDWGLKNPGRGTLRAALSKLVIEQKLKGNEKEGYLLQT